MSKTDHDIEVLNTNRSQSDDGSHAQVHGWTDEEEKKIVRKYVTEDADHHLQTNKKPDST